eukprot:746712-Pyramimonas_sp.AAC.1
MSETLCQLPRLPMCSCRIGYQRPIWVEVHAATAVRVGSRPTADAGAPQRSGFLRAARLSDDSQPSGR